MKYSEIIADNLLDAGWSLGWVSAIDLEGRTIWIVDAHGYGKTFHRAFRRDTDDVFGTGDSDLRLWRESDLTSWSTFKTSACQIGG